GHQDGLSGLIGTWSEPGVQCESCHGAGGNHVNKPYGVAMTVDRSSEQCGTCHYRGDVTVIDASGGFIKHHEQWDEFVATKHYANGMNCLTYHNPHKRTIWDGDAITKTCETCHGSTITTLNHAAGPNCVDCHMPFAAKSGTKRGSSGYKGDVRSHLMDITADTASMFTPGG
ncbi:hypothetical protein LCGC14_2552820, partial [marine sediment metagenome]